MTTQAHKTVSQNCTQNIRFRPFVFTGKERDEETGVGYFGARYMDHELMTGWLSVDPMADKYPSISPYAYCAWNPVKLVDPDGMECFENLDWYKNGKGEIVWDKNICRPDDVKDKNGEYIGNDRVLLERFGFHQKYSQGPRKKIGYINVNSTDFGSASHLMNAKATMSVKISISSTDLGNGRKKLSGFDINVQTDSKTTGSNSRITYSDMVSVSYGDRQIQEQPKYSYNAVYRDGLGRDNTVSHKFFIPVNMLSKNKLLQISGKGSWMTEDRKCFVIHPGLPYPHYATFNISNK